MDTHLYIHQESLSWSLLYVYIFFLGLLVSFMVYMYIYFFFKNTMSNNIINIGNDVKKMVSKHVLQKLTFKTQFKQFFSLLLLVLN
jgi:hypothetical protein